jgi:hypothetical protein
MTFIIRVLVLFGVQGPGNTAYVVAPCAVRHGEPS